MHCRPQLKNLKDKCQRDTEIWSAAKSGNIFDGAFVTCFPESGSSGTCIFCSNRKVLYENMHVKGCKFQAVINILNVIKMT